MFFSRRKLIDFWIILVFASIFDIVFTLRTLRYESSKEMNFIMQSVMGCGITQVFLVKFLPIVVLGILVFFSDKIRLTYRKWILNWGITICALILLVVLIIHLYFYFSLIILEK